MFKLAIWLIGSTFLLSNYNPGTVCARWTTPDGKPMPQMGATVTSDWKQLEWNERSLPAGELHPISTPKVAGSRTHIAVAGDTVSKWARQFLGSNTKTNRDAIISLNATLKQNPDRIIVGHTYLIPAKPTKSTAVSR